MTVFYDNELWEAPIRQMNKDAFLLFQEMNSGMCLPIEAISGGHDLASVECLEYVDVSPAPSC